MDNMKHYDKAVRDRIPQIIREQGKTCTTKTLNDQEFLPYLETKLTEELNEYKESRDFMELADLLEVLNRILEIRGSSFDELDNLRLSKKKKRGGFNENRVLLTVQE